MKLKLNSNSKKSIMHITPHLGGGVGTVLLDYLEYVKNDNNLNHSVYCLDYANDNAKNKSKNIGFKLEDNMQFKIKELIESIELYDIILIHFWNHPLLYNFLIRNELPKCRIVMWSHISGLYPPNVFTNKILNYPDKFIFTTPMSFNAKEVKNNNNYSYIYIYIWSTSNLNKWYNLERINTTDNFNVLYVGTVDFVKMHPNFLEICDKIKIPNIKFIVLGGPNNLILENKAKQMGIAHKFNFVGKTSDVESYIKISDVFGYPLNRNHFGTCDQSLQEAMSSGLVPVVLDNPMEKYMVKSNCGIICSNENEYINAIEELYKDKKLLNILSRNTKEYAKKEFSIEKMSLEWQKVFNEIINIEKTKKNWNINDKNNLKAIDIFFESIGEYKNLFNLDNELLKEELNKPNWLSYSKGTPKQYDSFLHDGSLDRFIF